MTTLQIEIENTVIELAEPDNQPRRDYIYRACDDDSLYVLQGEPYGLEPEWENDPFIADEPSPPDPLHVNGVILADIFVRPDAVVLSHADVRVSSDVTYRLP